MSLQNKKTNFVDMDSFSDIKGSNFSSTTSSDSARYRKLIISSIIHLQLWPAKNAESATRITLHVNSLPAHIVQTLLSSLCFYTVSVRGDHSRTIPSFCCSKINLVPPIHLPLFMTPFATRNRTSLSLITYSSHVFKNLSRCQLECLANYHARSTPQ